MGRFSHTIASVVSVIIPTLELARIAAISIAAGSMMPASYMSLYSLFTASHPCQVGSFWTRLTTTEGLTPEFRAIRRMGASKASAIIRAPMAASPDSFSDTRTAASLARNNEVPPPGTIPSRKATFAAPTASSALSLRCCISCSVIPPTATTPTDPPSVAMRRSIFVTQAGLVSSSSCARIWFWRS